jgi:serine/threonine protein kinase
MSAAAVRPGAVLRAESGRCYRLRAWHAEGSYARVYRAEETATAAACAVKLAKLEVAGATARLEREAQIRRQFRHPGIPELRDWGRAGELPFLTLTWIEGSTLRVLLERQRGLPLVRALDLLQDVAEVVARLHAAGLAHGDLRADNILVTDGQGRTRAVVSDLGSASRRGEPGWDAALAGDARSLAALLCRMLTAAPDGPSPEGLSTDRGQHPGAVRLWEQGSQGILTASAFLREVAALRGKIQQPLR